MTERSFGGHKEKNHEYINQSPRNDDLADWQCVDRSSASCRQGPVVDESGAAQITRIAGAKYVPEASLKWPAHLTPEAGVPDLLADISWMGQPYMNHPAIHVSGAAQIIKIAGAQYVPQASLYVEGHVEPESGASQMTRVLPGTMIPEAALYSGEQAPWSITQPRM